MESTLVRGPFVSGLQIRNYEVVTQISHNFIVGDVVQQDISGSFVKAQRGTNVQKRIGMIEKVDGDTFKVVFDGLVSTPGTSWTPNTLYYVSETAGVLSTAEQGFTPVFLALTTNSGRFFQESQILTSTVDALNANINAVNLALTSEKWERVSKEINAEMITGICTEIGTNPITLNSPNHGLQTGDRVRRQGRRWTITIIDPDNFSLDGTTTDSEITISEWELCNGMSCYTPDGQEWAARFSGVINKEAPIWGWLRKDGVEMVLSQEDLSATHFKTSVATWITYKREIDRCYCQDGVVFFQVCIPSFTSEVGETLEGADAGQLSKAASFIVDEHIYYLGGAIDPDKLWRASIHTPFKTTQIATLPGAGNYSPDSIAIINDIVYFFSRGTTIKVFSAPITDLTNWTAADTTVSSPGYMPQFYRDDLNGKIYLYGGSSSSNRICNADFSDPTNLTVSGATLALGIDRAPLIECGNYLLTLGGYVSGTIRAYFQYADKRNPTAWVRGTDLSVGLYYSVFYLSPDKLHFFIGGSSSGFNTGGFFIDSQSPLHISHISSVDFNMQAARMSCFIATIGESTFSLAGLDTFPGGIQRFQATDKQWRAAQITETSRHWFHTGAEVSRYTNYEESFPFWRRASTY